MEFIVNATRILEIFGYSLSFLSIALSIFILCHFRSENVHKHVYYLDIIIHSRDNLMIFDNCSAFTFSQLNYYVKTFKDFFTEY